MHSFNRTPQLHLIGKMTGGTGFNATSLYVRFAFKTGDAWTIIAGKVEAETVESKPHPETNYFALEHPLDINYSSRGIRGWPKLLVEAWEVDMDGRHKVAGYGQMTMPTKGGDYKLNIHCWRPAPSFSDRLLGTHPELENKDILVSNNSRFPLRTESTGIIQLEISILLKDFDLHGFFE
eukprot:TRINITY_DN2419_c0_g1_i1.p1 TRINITY_DN2419_c0_g1~~TRINITY_DN2419_c0_g1_i1.p1  ORF type:complete len:179 (-),score=26.83 TRINITY_DN2419_c0_g1_i1:144-680(-)